MSLSILIKDSHVVKKTNCRYKIRIAYTLEILSNGIIMSSKLIVYWSMLDVSYFWFGRWRVNIIILTLFKLTVNMYII